MRDLYEILGVGRGAEAAEIKRAYRQLAKKNHPDLNKDDPAAEKRFKEATSAFEILGNAEKRRQYDAGEIDAEGKPRIDPSQFYKQYANRGPKREYTSWNADQGFDPFAEARAGTGAGAEGIDLDELLSGLFGRGQQGARRGGGGFSGFSGHHPTPPAQDVYYRLDIDFLEAAKGARKRVTMPDGQSLDVNIPAGVEDGQKLRLKGKGRPSHGGGAVGDAYVSLSVAPHPFFRRDGRDLSLTLPISLDEAVLGAKVDVPTLSGKVSLNIPKGADSGQKMRLKGKGIAPARGTAGDLYVELKIMTPPEIDPQLAEAIENWSKSHAYGARLRRHLTSSS